MVAQSKVIGKNKGYLMITDQKLNKKTKQLIAYLIDKHAVATVTSIVKLCYLSDLVYYQTNKEQISDLQYIRWHYGPYDAKISQYLFELVNEGVVDSEVAFTNDGNEYFRYFLKDKEYDYSLLSAKELDAINSLLNSLVGYGAKGLIQVAYKTKPMSAIKATIGGKEGMGLVLDLAAK